MKHLQGLKYKNAVKINIERLKQKMGISQSDIVRATGLSQKAVSELENGKRAPSEKTLELLTKLFNVEETEITSDPELIEMKNKLKKLK